ncbi:MAG: radical SAM protein, partial [Nitrospinota bacterium]
IFKAAQLSKTIKKTRPEIKIIVGGPHITAVPEETMSRFPELDIAAIGEGEDTLKDLVAAIENSGRLKDIPGILFRENSHFTSLKKITNTNIVSGKVKEIGDSGLNSVKEKMPKVSTLPSERISNGAKPSSANNTSLTGFIKTEHRPLIKNPDELPFPAWDLIDNFPLGYKPAAFKCKRLPAAYIISARGCPHLCIFCDTSVFSRQYRAFSAEYIIEMIKFLQLNFGIREIIFEDDTFVIFKKRLIQLCETLIKEKINITWSCNGRANAVKPDILRLMKKAGCWQISYGIESGDPKILEFSRKRIKIDQMRQALEWTHEAGILTKGFFILGFPLETEETIKKTIDFAKSSCLDDISVSQMTPFPGSEMYNIGEKYGSINKNWEKMNLLDVVFVPHGLTKEKLDIFQRKFLKEFYLRPGIIKTYIMRLIKNPGNIKGLLSGFKAFFQTVFSFHLQTHKISWTKKDCS